MEPRLNRQPM